MPEYTNFTVIALQGLLCAVKSFLYGEILMIASNDAHLFIHSHCKGEVCNNINEAMFGKDTVEKSFKVGKHRAFITSVCGFPLHIAVKRCCYRANTGVCHVAYHKHLASSKELRNDTHIVLQLLVGFFRISDFARRRFQLNDRDRQTIDEHHYVGSFGGIAVYNRPLIGNYKRVLVYKVRICFDYLYMVTA